MRQAWQLGMPRGAPHRLVGRVVREGFLEEVVSELKDEGTGEG